LGYCHLHELGAKLEAVEGGEPNVLPMASDIDEAIAILKDQKGMDFGKTDHCKFYLETNRLLQEEYPQFHIAPLAGYSNQGVITSAVLMRGQDFFMDLYDEPEKVKEFLALLTDNITAFIRWRNCTNGQPEKSQNGSLADDFASLISPDMWSEFVIPYWNRYYEGSASGTYRWVHCEDMLVPHLKYLKDAKISEYQPSVSDKLTVASIKENTDIPFDWMIYSWIILEMSDKEIQDWVDYVVREGITKPRTQINAMTFRTGKTDRIFAFLDAFEKYRIE